MVKSNVNWSSSFILYEQKAWEVAQAPFKNLMMMGFMMWMAGSTVHLFSIGITFSALWQPISALQGVGKGKHQGIFNFGCYQFVWSNFFLFPLLCIYSLRERDRRKKKGESRWKPHFGLQEILLSYHYSKMSNDINDWSTIKSCHSLASFVSCLPEEYTFRISAFINKFPSVLVDLCL